MKSLAANVCWGVTHNVPVKHPETGEVVARNHYWEYCSWDYRKLESKLQFVQRSHVIQNMVYVNTVTDVTAEFQKLKLKSRCWVRCRSINQEPGTQSTMRTFHTGGVAGDDITQGLPRIQEIFEARSKGVATIRLVVGWVVSIEKILWSRTKEITIKKRLYRYSFLHSSIYSSSKWKKDKSSIVVTH